MRSVAPVAIILVCTAENKVVFVCLKPLIHGIPCHARLGRACDRQLHVHEAREAWQHIIVADSKETCLMCSEVGLLTEGLLSVLLTVT